MFGNFRKDYLSTELAVKSQIQLFEKQFNNVVSSLFKEILSQQVHWFYQRRS